MKLWLDTSKGEEVRIEIIPLIDVIFCILTFFILAAVGFSRQQAIGLNLPKANTGTAQMQEMLIVSLDDFGQVYVEKEPVSTRQQLYEAIQNYHQFNPAGLMVLHASRSASYDEVIQVLDILREVGGDRVALATLPGGGEGEGSALDVPPSNMNPYLGGNNDSFPPLNSPGSSFNPSVPSLPSMPGDSSSSFDLNLGVPTPPSGTEGNAEGGSSA
ncbi:MAG: ExbD/TolR family protein, partial [Chroococcales cyanobacterium]